LIVLEMGIPESVEDLQNISFPLHGNMKTYTLPWVSRLEYPQDY